MIVFKTLVVAIYVFLFAVALTYFIEDIVIWVKDKLDKLNKKRAKMKREDFNDLIRFAVVLIFVLLLLQRLIAYLLDSN
jgi:hypothetical protein